MIIIERVTRIYIFFIFGYVKNLDQKGGKLMGTWARWVGDSHIIHKYIGTSLLVGRGVMNCLKKLK